MTRLSRSKQLDVVSWLSVLPLHVLKYKHNTGTCESPILFPMDVTAGCALAILSDLIVGFGQEIKEPNQHGVLHSLSLDKLVSSNMILGSAKQGCILHKKRTSVITANGSLVVGFTRQ